MHQSLRNLNIKFFFRNWKRKGPEKTSQITPLPRNRVPLTNDSKTMDGCRRNVNIANRVGTMSNLKRGTGRGNEGTNQMNGTKTTRKKFGTYRRSRRIGWWHWFRNLDPRPAELQVSFPAPPPVFLLNENNEKLFERGKMSRPFFEKLFLLLFEIKFQCVVYHSIALKKLYNFTFYCVKIGPSVRPQIHENHVRVRAPSTANLTVSVRICGRSLGPIDLEWKDFW